LKNYIVAAVSVLLQTCFLCAKYFSD